MTREESIIIDVPLESGNSGNKSGIGRMIEKGDQTDDDVLRIRHVRNLPAERVAGSDRVYSPAVHHLKQRVMYRSEPGLWDTLFMPAHKR